MQAAILEGLYNGTGQPLLSCPTGNCTWTDLTTLGVCGGCEDITSLIKTQCPGRPKENIGRYECDYEMPLNLTLTGLVQSYGGSGISSQTIWNSSAAPLGILQTDPPPGSPALLSVFEAIQLPEGPLMDGLPPVKGTRCTVMFCTKDYAQINVTNGIPSKLIPKEDALMLGQPSDRQCGPTCGPEKLVGLAPNSSVNRGGRPSNFTVNVADYANIQAYLKEMFTSSWDSLGLLSGQLSTPADAESPTAPDVGRELANAPDLDKMIKAIADSITESIRTSPNSTVEPGQSYIQKTFIEIRWGWLAYPIALMLLTLVLLVAVIVETQRKDVVAWKSSSLALLFHKLDGWDVPEHGVRNRQELDRMAERMRRRLWDGGEHPAFIKED